MKNSNRKPLDITFHNPNTPEKTINYMVKVFAQELYHQTMDKPKPEFHEKSNREIERKKSRSNYER